MQIDNIINSQLDRQSMMNNMVTLDNTHWSLGSRFRTNDYMSQMHSEQEPSLDPTGSPVSKINMKRKE